MAQDLLKWDSLQFNGMGASLNPPSVAIKEIALNNAFARVVVETNRTINLLTALHPAETNAPKATHPVVAVKNPTNPTITNATASSLPKISVASIVISNATISFTDRSLTPNVHLAIEQAGGTIADISSEELRHADVNLHAAVDGISAGDHHRPDQSVQRHGNKPPAGLREGHGFDPGESLLGQVRRLRNREGKLNIDLVYGLVGNKLSSKNVITLDQFTFGEKINSPEATHLPVRLAVAILKDRDGKIVFDVPVDGSLGDPEFRVNKVVPRAIVNILEKAATSPFSLLAPLLAAAARN